MNIAMFHYLMLTTIVFFKTILFVGGIGMCASNVHIDQESNRCYKSFMYLDSIGVLQCIKVCKRYKLCEKIYHNRKKLTCELMMTYTEASNMKPLLDVQSVQIESSGCSRDSCSEREICVDRRDGIHICLHQGPCPSVDWVSFNRKCYLFSVSIMTGDEGVAFCDSINATLVRSDNTEVNTFLVSEMGKRGITSIWLSANDRAVENEWIWGPGDVVLNALWLPGEPNNWENEDCCILDQNTQSWYDIGCARSEMSTYAVCEDFFHSHRMLV